MRTPEGNPFSEPRAVRRLYADPRRLHRRTTALLAAKTAGRPTAAVLTELVRRHCATALDAADIIDVGCGRGTSTLGLATLAPAHLIALDLSAPLLSATAARLRAAGHSAATVRADFHHLPLRTGRVHAAVAAFCLYHAPDPVTVLAELRGALAPGGIAVLATKSLDSYRDLDQLVAASGLDPAAMTRPSLYTTCHSQSLPDQASACLRVEQVEHETHSFTFATPAHLAEYLSTSPKYRHDSLVPAAIAAALAKVMTQPVTTTSTVTYVVARRQP